MRNFFTQKDVPRELQLLVYEQPLTLTSLDVPYFAVRSFDERRSAPIMTGGGFTDPFKELTDISGFAVVDLSGYSDKDRALVMDELHFGEALGLVTHRGDRYYIHPFAYLLYDQEHGLFAPGAYLQDMEPDTKKNVFGALMRLMLTYVLPGRYWRAFYARQALPATIALAALLDEEMRGIEETWQQINAEYPLPE